VIAILGVPALLETLKQRCKQGQEVGLADTNTGFESEIVADMMWYLYCCLLALISIRSRLSFHTL
jgi:hypothetical protein